MYFTSDSWGQFDSNSDNWSYGHCHKYEPIIKEEITPQRDYTGLHKETLMILINEALDKKDEQLFMKLTDQLKLIELIKD